MLKILITAGGTTEKIDSVRNISNSSSGKLGIKIANAFKDKFNDAEIYFVHSYKVEELPYAKNYSIKTVEDLEKTMLKLLSEEKIDIVIHSMAVSDFTTNFVFDINKLQEKIVNNKENITDKIFMELLEESKIDNTNKILSNANVSINLKNTPKIIEMIKKTSPRTFLVGFKLLDDVNDNELFDVGFNLLRKNRCNLVIANDIKKIRSGNHEALFIYPEKTYDKFIGKDEIAKKLVEIVAKRFFTRHPHSECKGTNNEIKEELFQKFYETGKYLYEKGYLPEVMNHERNEKIGTYGNMSSRYGEGFYITSRNVHKGHLTPNDISLIESVDELDEKDVFSSVNYKSILKPSIDTSIHYFLYKKTKFTNIVHIHTDNIFLGVPYIDDQFPCGCENEKNAILEKIGDNQIVQMKKHGIVVLGYSFEECIKLIEDLFNGLYIADTDKIDTESKSHIDEVKATFCFESGCFKNIYYNNKIIGIVWEDINEKTNHFGIFTKENSPHGLNIAKKYLNLYDKDYILCTMPECNIIPFYEKYGFHVIQNEPFIKMKRN